MAAHPFDGIVVANRDEARRTAAKLGGPARLWL
jgi:hypothetical protein